MGRAIAEASRRRGRVYDAASEAVGFDLAKLCFEGSMEELTRTELQQPALVRDLARVPARRRDASASSPTTSIGHSVGEYSALAAAGALDGVRRGRARARARRGDGRGGARDSPARWRPCSGSRTPSSRSSAPRSTNVWPANYNCPGQVVVSGENEAVDRLLEEAAARGARKTVKLRVSGAFHSPLVARAGERLKPALARASVPRPGAALHVDGDGAARGRAAARGACSSSSSRAR